jgi:hypothetical protein
VTLRPDCPNACERGWLERTRPDGRDYVEPCPTCQPLKARIFRDTVGRPEERARRLRENFGKAQSWTHGGGGNSG